MSNHLTRPIRLHKIVLYCSVSPGGGGRVVKRVSVCVVLMCLPFSGVGVHGAGGMGRGWGGEQEERQILRFTEHLEVGDILMQRASVQRTCHPIHERQ